MNRSDRNKKGMAGARRAVSPGPENLVRALVRSVEAYVPGEQPKIPGLIKLNTNENPHPPSPKVLAAIQAAVDQRLRLYPDPRASLLREQLARLHGCEAGNIVVGNGSDELLALATRAFVEPLPGGGQADRAGKSGNSGSSCTVQFFTPSYSLYPVLAGIHGARANSAPLRDDFTIPSLSDLREGKQWDFEAALTFITTPNAPSGRGYLRTELEVICAAQNGVVVLDEAYAEFSDENALELAFRYPNVLVSRSFSKAYSLCFQRIGYFVGHPALIAALDKIRDSYNVNGLGQVGALATLKDLSYYRAGFRKVVATRERVARELTDLGFKVFPSQTNFLLVRPPRFSAPAWAKRLRERKILVRWFGSPDVRNYLRITIGTDAEMELLLQAGRSILRGKR